MADDKDRERILKCVEAGAYHATPEELAGIRRGLKAAREGRFATDDEIERLFEKHRPT
jgi:predicted transcriptional regulator